MRANNEGFTLIELMIVIAIIAILAAIASVAYQDYVIRTQVAEGVSAAMVGGSEDQITEYYTEYGHLPTDNVSVSLPSATSTTGNYVNAVYIGNAAGGPGFIKVTFSDTGKQQANAAINGLAIVITPSPQSGSMEWSCKSALNTVSPRYLPTPCR
jgi:type IV pilus assembly protein PilA